MPAPDPLQTLARLYNLQTVYHDGLGELRKAPPEAILSVLKSLGAAVASMADVSSALRGRHQELWQRAIEPVTVAWQDQPRKIKLRLPVRLAQLPVSGEIVLENGERIEGQFDEMQIAQPLIKEVEGARYIARTLVRDAPLPLGYHRVHLRVGDLEIESSLFAAPYHAYVPPEPNAKRWGVFCPLYAVHSRRSWGAGDVSDLAELARWVGAMKGHAVATLPMLAAFLDEPFNPSPYAPVSRLYWNEFYLDVTKIPELAHCPAAQELLDSGEFRRELEAVRRQSLVDYRKVMALKRGVLEAMLDNFLPMNSPRAARVSRNLSQRSPACESTPPFAPKASANGKPGRIGRKQIATARWRQTATASALDRTIFTSNGSATSKRAGCKARAAITARRFILTFRSASIVTATMSGASAIYLP